MTPCCAPLKTENGAWCVVRWCALLSDGYNMMVNVGGVKRMS